MYELILSREASKVINRMTPRTRECIFRMLEKLKRQPRTESSKRGFGYADKAAGIIPRTIRPPYAKVSNIAAISFL